MKPEKISELNEIRTHDFSDTNVVLYQLLIAFIRRVSISQHLFLNDFLFYTRICGLKIQLLHQHPIKKFQVLKKAPEMKHHNWSIAIQGNVSDSQ